MRQEQVTTEKLKAKIQTEPKKLDLLGQAIERTATHLNLQREELILWLDQQTAPLYTQLLLLRLADKYQLDPLSDEIGIFEHEDHTQGVYITIDGWAKLMNHHPQYTGMSLRESQEQTNHIPNWMECTIYRNDRILPIVIKEYFDEVRTTHPSWSQMPRRMLRHRVIQQCARLALGISCPESLPKELTINPNGQTIQVSPVTSHTQKMKELLRTTNV